MISEAGKDKDGSVAITDQKVLKKYIDDPAFPFLVSFPRTGSHWLRMLMELYFERPSLVRVFYYRNKKDYLTLHTHDLDLDVYRKNVIYLYRNPVPTVYSHMMYEKEDLNNTERVKYWTTLYGRHLRKWLVEEKASEKKTIIRYENMQRTLPTEFSRVAAHFGMALDPAKLKSTMKRVSKQEVKEKTTHDKQVVILSSSYTHNREDFAKKYGDMIRTLIFKAPPTLKEFFKD